MLTTLAIVAVTVVGTMVGVEFAVAVFVNPIFLRLPAGAALEARADGGRVLGRVMPFWYVGSLLLTAGLAAATWGRSAAGAGAAIAAAALLAVSVVMSVALLVPINNRSVTWTASDHPDDYREQQQRWDRLHYIRVAIIIAAFVLTVVAATVR
jgi:Anthrone oxygenase